MKTYNIRIAQFSKTQGKRKEMLMKASIIKNEFDDHDTAACLFALEFAGNNQKHFPCIRVYIEESNT